MRNKHLLLALAVVLLPPALTGAATLDQLTATADCNGWSAEATVAFRPGALMVLLVFSMQLADSTGAEIERFDSEQWLTVNPGGTTAYPFGNAWLAPLDRDLTMIVHATVWDARGDRFTTTEDEVRVAVACAADGEEPPVEVCRHAARWWVRHQREWPVTSLTLGSERYESRQIVRLLRSPFGIQVGRRLAHQLAVAKLNLANGVSNSVEGQVADADAWLSAHPLGTNNLSRCDPRGAERREALRLIKVLCRFNHGGCRDGSQLLGDEDDGDGKSGLGFDLGDTDVEFTGDRVDYDETAKAAEENMSLGTVKALYR